MSEKKKRIFRCFSKIESRDDALEVVKEVSLFVFFFVAIWVMKSIMLRFLTPAMIIGQILLVGFAFWLMKFKSTIAALALLISSILLILSLFSLLPSLGVIPFLTLILLWASIRAVEATFNWNITKRLEPTDPGPQSDTGSKGR